MTIDKITIKNNPIFANSTEMDGLKPVNFIFGTNGCGKTTISRLFRDYSDLNKIEIDPVLDPGTEIKVFNSDYISENFLSSEDLPGIFTIGQKNIRIAKEIQKLEKELAELDADTEASKEKLKKDGDALSEIRNQLKSSVFERLRKLKRDGFALKAFDEYPSGKKLNADCFLDLVGVYKDKVVSDLDGLEMEAEALYSPDAKRIEKPESIGVRKIVKLNENPILGKSIVGRNDLDISGLVKSLQNSDWVRKGTDYLEKSDGLCPFCQQKISDHLGDEIKSFFDDEYEKDIDALDQLKYEYKEESSRILSQIRDIIYGPETDRFFSRTPIKFYLHTLERIFTQNLNSIDEKINHPSEKITLERVDPPIKTINKIIGMVSVQIEKWNAYFDNRERSKKEFPAKLVKFLVDDMGPSFMNLYEKERETREAFDQKSSQISKDEIEIRDLHKALRKLSRSISGVVEVKDKINEFLKKRCFRNFMLEVTDDKEHYKIVRPGGESAVATLSEGERNLLAFVYFYLSLEENLDGFDRIIFIDDPVSSLDNDSLFFVVSMVRELIENAKEKKEHISQLFIATHNFYFYKEITYGPDPKKKDAPSYWMVEKDGINSVIKHHESNPITSIYRNLWGAVKKSKDNVGSADSASLQNTMRRILEYFFSFYYKRDSIRKVKEKIVSAMADPDSRMAARSLLLWVNDGSHGALYEESEYSSGTSGEIQMFLDTFETVFKECGHKNHYDEMMK